MATPLAKNATCVTVAPALGVADAVTVTAAPTAALELFVGVEIETVGSEATAVTVTGAESVILPLSSIA